MIPEDIIGAILGIAIVGVFGLLYDNVDKLKINNKSIEGFVEKVFIVFMILGALMLMASM